MTEFKDIFAVVDEMGEVKQVPVKNPYSKKNKKRNKKGFYVLIRKG